MSGNERIHHYVIVTKSLYMYRVAEEIKINHGEQKQFLVKVAHPPIISKEMFETV